MTRTELGLEEVYRLPLAEPGLGWTRSSHDRDRTGARRGLRMTGLELCLDEVGA
jgi:hypothetical protein